MAKPLPATNEAYAPIGTPEPILRHDRREISLLVANEDLGLTYASRPAGEPVTHPHTHQHTEAFYVLEGELTFEVGAEGETITIGAGGFLATPPGLAHS
jgi:quercetin dioxygenase-like cupin family protein